MDKEISTNQQHMEKVLKQVIERTKSPDGSGIINMMQPQYISCDFESKSFTTKYHVSKWELNPQGSMHGGLICTAFDNTFGMLTHFLAEDCFITTVDIGTRFLKPIKEGCNIVINAKATSAGRTLVSLVAEAYVEETGLLAATASCTFMILRDKKTGLNTVGKE